MATTLPDNDTLLERLRDIMQSWDENATLGEIAIVGGGHEWEIEERPRQRRGRYARPAVRVGYAEKMK